MSSIFDQFEQASLRTKNNSMSSAEMSTLGYINMTLEQEDPIFHRSKKEFKPPSKITHAAISNKYFVAAMQDGTLFRMDLHNPQENDRITLTKYTQTCNLTNLFLDPSGNHLLITLAPKKDDSMPELLYLARKSTKLKTSIKFRGNNFTAVGWNTVNESESTTGPILLGTSKGLIFETDILLEGDKFFTTGFSSSLEQYWKQVFDIGKGTETPITGLEYHKVFGSGRCFIFASTPSRLYYFVGKAESDEPLLQQVFNNYLNIPEPDTYIESQSKVTFSKLQFWSENLTTPNTFAWITGNGITYGEIDTTSNDETIKTIKSKTTLIPYPKPTYEENFQNTPMSFALTQFHILLAYPDSIKGMCLLNQEVVYEDTYNEAFGRLINIIKDPRNGDIWAITESAMFRFKITREERNVWRTFCANKQFDLAKKYSRSNEACYNQVLIKEADMLFENKEYDLSAQRYAETQCSFEEICLKFIQAEQSDSLKIFLRHKLDTLKPQDKTQITMIVILVVELYLNKLEEKRLQGLEQSANYHNIQREFESFLALKEVSDCIKKNKTTIYDLMASHGDKHNLMELTNMNKDFEQLIRHHIYKNNFREALEVLKNHKNYELYYQFAPILMIEEPRSMVKTLIQHGRKLTPLRLLPALVNCNGELHAEEVMKYLEYCIDTLKNTDKAIHNFLISLYAKYNPAKLLKYLNDEGQELCLVHYDVHFALRLCHEHKQIEACVMLSGLLGLWESAVELALTVSVEKAQELANMSPENDLELRRKLWLKIAQHVVSNKQDIQQAMLFLKNCDLIKIEDILPFFSDFVTIDHFKDAICKSLKESNQNIKDIMAEMEEATKSAEQVRQEIQSFRNRYTIISSSETCQVCNNILLVKPFYLFPCQHKFHKDCLCAEISPTLGPAKRNRLIELERQLKQLNAQANVDTISTGSSGISTKDLVKSEIDNILASECLYCGENMIRNIDMPFIEDQDYEEVLKAWE